MEKESMLPGCYLLIILAEPICEDHKERILQRVAKGLLSWDTTRTQCDLKEIENVIENIRGKSDFMISEILLQHSTERLAVEVLISPQISTLKQCLKNLLLSPTGHKHVIHSGYSFTGTGSWMLEDGVFGFQDFVDAFNDNSVQNFLRSYPNGIFSLHIHCAPVGQWIINDLQEHDFSKFIKVELNPPDSPSGVQGAAALLDFFDESLRHLNLESKMTPTEIVGNIRFNRPTLYIFPSGQGDCSLFGITGFTMLIDGGFTPIPSFWNFIRHLERLDAIMVTRLNEDNLLGVSSLLKKKILHPVYPQIGYIFCNIAEGKSDSDKKQNDSNELLVSVIGVGQEFLGNLKQVGLNPLHCLREPFASIEPMTLYHKVGHGTLEMYILSPPRDNRILRDFLNHWNSRKESFSLVRTGSASQKGSDVAIPLSDIMSICCLLVWRPYDPNDTIARMMFPGSAPQSRIFEGLDKIQSLDILQHQTCTKAQIKISTSPVSKNLKDEKSNKFSRFRSASPISRSKPVYEKQQSMEMEKGDSSDTSTSPIKKQVKQQQLPPKKPTSRNVPKEVTKKVPPIAKTEKQVPKNDKSIIKRSLSQSPKKRISKETQLKTGKTKETKPQIKGSKKEIDNISTKADETDEEILKITLTMNGYEHKNHLNGVENEDILVIVNEKRKALEIEREDIEVQNKFLHSEYLKDEIEPDSLESVEHDGRGEICKDSLDGSEDEITADRSHSKTENVINVEEVNDEEDEKVSSKQSENLSEIIPNQSHDIIKELQKEECADKSQVTSLSTLSPMSNVSFPDSQSDNLPEKTLLLEKEKPSTNDTLSSGAESTIKSSDDHKIETDNRKQSISSENLEKEPKEEDSSQLSDKTTLELTKTSEESPESSDDLNESLITATYVDISPTPSNLEIHETRIVFEEEKDNIEKIEADSFNAKISLKSQESIPESQVFDSNEKALQLEKDIKTESVENKSSIEFSKTDEKDRTEESDANLESNIEFTESKTQSESMEILSNLSQTGNMEAIESVSDNSLKSGVDSNESQNEVQTEKQNESISIELNKDSVDVKSVSIGLSTNQISLKEEIELTDQTKQETIELSETKTSQNKQMLEEKPQSLISESKLSSHEIDLNIEKASDLVDEKQAQKSIVTDQLKTAVVLSEDVEPQNNQSDKSIESVIDSQELYAIKPESHSQNTQDIQSKINDSTKEIDSSNRIEPVLESKTFTLENKSQIDSKASEKIKLEENKGFENIEESSVSDIDSKETDFQINVIRDEDRKIPESSKISLENNQIEPVLTSQTSTLENKPEIDSKASEKIKLEENKGLEKIKESSVSDIDSKETDFEINVIRDEDRKILESSKTSLENNQMETSREKKSNNESQMKGLSESELLILHENDSTEKMISRDSDYNKTEEFKSLGSSDSAQKGLHKEQDVFSKETERKSDSISDQMKVELRGTQIKSLETELSNESTPKIDKFSQNLEIIDSKQSQESEYIDEKSLESNTQSIITKDNKLDFTSIETSSKPDQKYSIDEDVIRKDRKLSSESNQSIGEVVHPIKSDKDSKIDSHSNSIKSDLKDQNQTLVKTYDQSKGVEMEFTVSETVEELDKTGSEDSDLEKLNKLCDEEKSDEKKAIDKTVEESKIETTFTEQKSIDSSEKDMIAEHGTESHKRVIESESDSIREHPKDWVQNTIEEVVHPIKSDKESKIDSHSDSIKSDLKDQSQTLVKTHDQSKGIEMEFTVSETVKELDKTGSISTISEDTDLEKLNKSCDKKISDEKAIDKTVEESKIETIITEQKSIHSLEKDKIVEHGTESHKKGIESESDSIREHPKDWVQNTTLSTSEKQLNQKTTQIKSDKESKIDSQYDLTKSDLKDENQTLVKTYDQSKGVEMEFIVSETVEELDKTGSEDNDLEKLNKLCDEKISDEKVIDKTVKESKIETIITEQKSIDSSDKDKIVEHGTESHKKVIESESDSIRENPEDWVQSTTLSTSEKQLNQKTTQIKSDKESKIDSQYDLIKSDLKDENQTLVKTYDQSKGVEMEFTVSETVEELDKTGSISTISEDTDLEKLNKSCDKKISDEKVIDKTVKESKIETIITEQKSIDSSEKDKIVEHGAEYHKRVSESESDLQRESAKDWVENTTSSTSKEQLNQKTTQIKSDKESKIDSQYDLKDENQTLVKTYNESKGVEIEFSGNKLQTQINYEELPLPEPSATSDELNASETNKQKVGDFFIEHFEIQKQELKDNCVKPDKQVIEDFPSKPLPHEKLDFKDSTNRFKSDEKDEEFLPKSCESEMQKDSAIKSVSQEECTEQFSSELSTSLQIELKDTDRDKTRQVHKQEDKDYLQHFSKLETNETEDLKDKSTVNIGESQFVSQSNAFEKPFTDKVSSHISNEESMICSQAIIGDTSDQNTSDQISISMESQDFRIQKESADNDKFEESKPIAKKEILSDVELDNLTTIPSEKFDDINLIKTEILDRNLQKVSEEACFSSDKQVENIDSKSKFIESKMHSTQDSMVSVIRDSDNKSQYQYQFDDKHNAQKAEEYLFSADERTIATEDEKIKTKYSSTPLTFQTHSFESSGAKNISNKTDFEKTASVDTISWKESQDYDILMGDKNNKIEDNSQREIKEVITSSSFVDSQKSEHFLIYDDKSEDLFKRSEEKDRDFPEMSVTMTTSHHKEKPEFSLLSETNDKTRQQMEKVDDIVVKSENIKEQTVDTIDSNSKSDILFKAETNQEFKDMPQSSVKSFSKQSTDFDDLVDVQQIDIQYKTYSTVSEQPLLSRKNDIESDTDNEKLAFIAETKQNEKKTDSNKFNANETMKLSKEKQNLELIEKNTETVMQNTITQSKEKETQFMGKIDDKTIIFDSLNKQEMTGPSDLRTHDSSGQNISSSISKMSFDDKFSVESGKMYNKAVYDKEYKTESKMDTTSEDNIIGMKEEERSQTYIYGDKTDKHPIKISSEIVDIHSTGIQNLPATHIRRSSQIVEQPLYEDSDEEDSSMKSENKIITQSIHSSTLVADYPELITVSGGTTPSQSAPQSPYDYKSISRSESLRRKDKTGSISTISEDSDLEKLNKLYDEEKSDEKKAIDKTVKESKIETIITEQKSIDSSEKDKIAEHGAEYHKRVSESESDLQRESAKDWVQNTTSSTSKEQLSQKTTQIKSSVDKTLEKESKESEQSIETLEKEIVIIEATSSTDNKFNVDDWGKPLKLPTPPDLLDSQIKSSYKGTAKKTTNIISSNPTPKIKQSTLKPTKKSSGTDGSSSSVYVDLAYVPNHADQHYCNSEYFQRVRARYYVFSGIDPHREVFEALIEGKKSWDKQFPTTVIPTHESEALGFWISNNQDLLTEYKIDVAPAANRCTVNLQDHETKCSAYRVEF